MSLKDSRFKPIHPEEVARDWHWLTPESLAFVQACNVRHIAQKLGLSKTGTARLMMIFGGSSVTMTENGPAAIRGENGHPYLIPPKDWDRIKLLFNPKDVEKL